MAEIRNIGPRNEEEEQYEGLVARDMNLWGVPHGAGQPEIGQIHAADQAFLQARDRDRSHEAKVGFDEKGRVNELNAEYLDRITENYTHQYLQADQEYRQRRWGGGWLGNLNQWANETVLGKSIKVGLKFLAAAGLNAASVVFPPALGLGAAVAADAVGELVQAIPEFALIAQRQNADRERARGIRDAKRISGAIQNENDDTSYMSGRIVGHNETLGQEIQSVIERIQAADQAHANSQRRLETVRAWGAGARFLFNTTAGVHALSGALSVDMGAGILGLGTVAGAGAVRAADAFAHAGFARNPEAQAVFSVRGRRQPGNTQFEISNEPGRTGEEKPVAEDREATLDVLKSQLLPGSLWNLPSLDDRGVIMAEIISYADGTLRFYALDANGNRANDGRVFSHKGDELIRGSSKVAETVADYIESRSVDPAIRQLSKSLLVPVPNSGDVWEPKNRANASIQTIAEVPGDTADPIEILAGQKVMVSQLADQKTRARVNILDNNNKVINSVIVRVDGLMTRFMPTKLGKPTKTAESGTAAPSPSGGTTTPEAENPHEVQLNELNKEISDLRKGATALEENQIWLIGGSWYVIGKIAKDNGSVVIYSGRGALPQPNEIKRPANADTQTFEELRQIFSATAPADIRYKDKMAGGGGGKGKGGGTTS